MTKRINRPQTNFSAPVEPEPEVETEVEEASEPEPEYSGDELPEEVVEEFLADEDFSETASTQIADEEVSPELPNKSPYEGDGFGSEVVSEPGVDPESEVVSEEVVPPALTEDEQKELQIALTRIKADADKETQAADKQTVKRAVKKVAEANKRPVRHIQDGQSEQTTPAKADSNELLSDADCNAWCQANLLQITYSTTNDQGGEVKPYVLLQNYHNETIGAGSTLAHACHAAGLRQGAAIDPNEVDPVDEP